MTRHRFLAAFLFTVLAAAIATARAQSGDDVALRAAIETETIKGDLKSAIAQYQKLAASADRTVAATALLRIGACYERLGQADAESAYSQIVARFGDQKEQAAEAAKRLAALQTTGLNLFRSIRPDEGFQPNSVPATMTSPDGTLVLERQAGGSLTERNIRNGGKRVLVASGASWPAVWSPDGRSVAFIAGGAIRILDRQDGRLRNLVTTSPARLLRWTSRNEILFESGGGGSISLPQPVDFSLVSVTGGEPRKVFSLARSWHFGDVTPDGTAALVVRADHLALINLTTGAEHAVTLGIGVAYPRLSRDGRVVAFASKQSGSWGLYVAPFAASFLRQTLLLSRIDGDLEGSQTFLEWTSLDTLAFVSRAATSDIYRIDLDRMTRRPLGAVTRLTQDFHGAGPTVSPDGQHVAFVIRGPAGIAVMDSDGSNERRIIEFDSRGPVWMLGWGSPAEVVVKAAGAPGVTVVNINNRTTSRWDVEGAGNYLAAKDELWVVGRDNRHDIVAYRRVTGTSRIAWRSPTPIPSYFLPSPDGRLVAHSQTETNFGGPPTMRPLLINDIETGRQSAVRISGAPGAWTLDGRHLLFHPEVASAVTSVHSGPPHVVELASGMSWPLLDPAAVGKQLGIAGQWTWYAGSWAPDGSFVVGSIATEEVRRLGWAGVTDVAVRRALGAGR